MRALICGVSGQDGAYLAKLLLDRGYEVFGTSRDAEVRGFGSLERLGVEQPLIDLTRRFKAIPVPAAGVGRFKQTATRKRKT